MVVGDFANPSAALSEADRFRWGQAARSAATAASAGDVTNSGVIAPGSAAPGLSGSPMGAFTIKGNYTGAGGTMAINTVLGGDASPSGQQNGHQRRHGQRQHNRARDQCRWCGRGNDQRHSGGERDQRGDTTWGRLPFPLANLGGPAPSTAICSGAALAEISAPKRLASRSDFVSEPTTPEPPGCAAGSRYLPPVRRPTHCRPASPFQSAGPEPATYGWCSLGPAGPSILGTLDDRVGDTYEPDGCAVAPAVASAAAETGSTCRLRSRRRCRPGSLGSVPCPLFSPSGLSAGQTIHNNYQAFADPSAGRRSGRFPGRDRSSARSLIAVVSMSAPASTVGDAVHADVNGSGCTNPAATAYVLNHTGSMNLNSWSAGGYWTHTGPGGWYLDAVLQGTWYYGSASTQFARLNTDGLASPAP